MTPKQSNRFEYANAHHSSGVTVLNAVLSDFSFANHAHEELALGVTLEGLQEFACKGSMIRSSPGSVMVINPEEVHNGNPAGKATLKYTMIYLRPEDIFPFMGCASGLNVKEYRFTETNFADPVLSHLILQAAYRVADSERSVISYEHDLYQIAKHLTQRVGIYTPANRVSNVDSLLLRARDFIHDTIDREITIEELSEMAGMSKFHFIRLFRSQFGLTPHKYILNHRVNKARDPLELGISPTRVAQDFGFFDASHMNRHFKRVFGVTPKQYQLQFLR